MIELLGFFVLIFGFIIGSFLNVVALRLNTGRSVNGRSACFTCSTQLSWFELIPVLSYMLQQGKCNTCSARISKQYPIVEIVTGFVFLVIMAVETSLFTVITNTTLVLTFFYWLIAGILIVISIYDVKHKIIPDSLSYTFILISLAKLIVLYQGALIHEHIFDLLAGPILFLPFFGIWFISKGRWMGFGDAKLALGIGWLLGLATGISAIILAFWIGTVVMLGILFFEHLRHHIKRRAKVAGNHEPLGLKSEIPFAPFMIIGTLVAYITQVDVMSIKVLISLFTNI